MILNTVVLLTRNPATLVVGGSGKYGYVKKGCKATNADTFYLLEKGIKLVDNGGSEDD